jgi:hypothetical protein
VLSGKRKGLSLKLELTSGWRQAAHQIDGPCLLMQFPRCQAESTPKMGWGDDAGHLSTARFNSRDRLLSIRQVWLRTLPQWAAVLCQRPTNISKQEATKEQHQVQWMKINWQANSSN